MNNDGGDPKPINPTPETVVNNAVNPLDKLESVVVAAQQEAAQTAAPVQVPAESPAETPKEQFENQFGSGVTAPVAEAAVSSTLNTGTTITRPTVDASVPQPSLDNLTPEQTQPVVETPAQPEPEQTPAEQLKQQVADSVDAFLEQVTKEKTAV